MSNVAAREAEQGRTRGRVLSASGVRLVEAILFAGLPLVFMVSMLVGAWSEGIIAFDFVHFELPAAQIVADGGSPYPGYGYPPLVAFALVPFTWIPSADVIVTVLLILSVPAILWLLEVRDWRCYGAAFLWAPVFHAVQTANVTLPMMLFGALAWRFRDLPGRAGVSVGVATAAKILAWPFGLWLLATRRIQGWVIAVAATLALTFGLWAILGFDGLNNFSSNLQSNAAANANESYSLTQLVVDLGGSRSAGRVLAIALGVAILGLCAWAGVHDRARLSFALAATACVYASPIVWLHSFAFLLLAVAVLQPRLSVAWLVPLPFLLTSGTGNGEPWQTAVGLLCGLATVACAVRGRVPEQPAGRAMRGRLATLPRPTDV